jgi:2'-5' RNA ligase
MNTTVSASTNASLFVVAFPELSGKDRARIEEVRSRYHPRAAIIAAHLTLVFPTTLLDSESFVREVTYRVATTSSVDLVFRAALPFPDSEAGVTDVFLVPEEGFAALVRLSDALYDGTLRPARRLDLPMIPHLTVARLADPHDALKLADTLNTMGLAIPGRVSAVDVLERGSATVQSLCRLVLREPEVYR